MNSKIRKAFSEVTKLDSWDIQSTIGAVNFIVRQAAINVAVRMLPDPPPEGSGLEYFTRWEQAQKDPEIRKAISPFVGIADEATDILNQHTTQAPSDYEAVLQFMLERPPQKSTFRAEYDRRKAMGMRPGIPLNQFVEMEYATAMQRHANLVARGEGAVQVVSQVEGSDESAPEWIENAVMDKIHQKLEQRWMRAELRRTNPKVSKADRDLAAANQLMIEKVIEELGGKKPDFSEEMQNDDELDAFIASKTKGSPATQSSTSA